MNTADRKQPPSPESMRSATVSAGSESSASRVICLCDRGCGGSHSMQASINAFGQCCIDSFHPGDFFGTGALEAGQPAEVLEHGSTPSWTDPGHILQAAGNTRLLPFQIGRESGRERGCQYV